MARNEFLLLRILIFISLLFFGYHLFFTVFTPIIAPNGFLDSFAMLSCIVTAIGVHALLALAAFIASRFNSKRSFGSSLFMLSWITPLLYLALNFHLFTSLSLTTVTVGLLLISLLDLKFKTLRKNLVKNYRDLILFVIN
jgi:hypothetical protein